MFHARLLADAWCVGFVWPKNEGAPEAITQQVFAELTQDAHTISREIEKEIERIADRRFAKKAPRALRNLVRPTGRTIPPTLAQHKNP